MFDQKRDDLDNRWAMDLRRRSITHEQMHRFEGYMAEIFAAFGLDLHTPAIRNVAVIQTAAWVR